MNDLSLSASSAESAVNLLNSCPGLQERARLIRRLQLFFQQLPFVKIRVLAVECEQLFVRSAFDYLSVIENADQIRITDRRRGWVMMTLNLNLVDAAGRTTTVTGRAQASSDRFTLSCT